MNNIEGEYIYKLIDPSTNEIRWIGRTTDPHARLLSHIASKAENSEKEAWIARLRECGNLPLMEIIETVTTGHPIDRERYWINWHFEHGSPLLNKTHTIIGYNAEHQKQKQRSSWLHRFLLHLPEDLTSLDRLVLLTLYSIGNAEEKPFNIHIGTIVKLTGASHHALTDLDSEHVGSLHRLHRLGLITYERINKHTTIITVHLHTFNREG